MKMRSAVLSLGFTLLAQAQTSKDNPKLQAAHEWFPQADAHGDDVLTLEKRKEFKQKAGWPGKKDDQGNGIRSSYHYKTVGNDTLELFVDTAGSHTKNAKAPAIVFFHGGFKTGSMNQFRTQSTYLADLGMVGIRVRYRLTREKGVEVRDCVEDAISAMRWVRANAGELAGDPHRICQRRNCTEPDPSSTRSLSFT